MLWRARGVPEDGGGRRLPSAAAAFRPLDPTLIAQCVFPHIGRRPVACSAIVLRLFERGAQFPRARLLFYPPQRVDSRLRQQWLAASADNFPSCEVKESERTAVVAVPARDRHERATARRHASRTSFGTRVRRRHYASASFAVRLRSVDGHDGASLFLHRARTSLTFLIFLRLVYVSFFQETLFSAYSPSSPAVACSVHQTTFTPVGRPERLYGERQLYTAIVSSSPIPRVRDP